MPSTECDARSTNTTSPESRRPWRFTRLSCATENSGPEITTPASSSESCHRANSTSRRHRFGCTSKPKQRKLVSPLSWSCPSVLSRQMYDVCLKLHIYEHNKTIRSQHTL